MKQSSHVTCGRKSTRSGCAGYNKKQEGARQTINLLPGVVEFCYYSSPPIPPFPPPLPMTVFHSNSSFFHRPKLPVFFSDPLFMWRYLCLPVSLLRILCTSVNLEGISLFCVACSGLISLHKSGLETLFLLFSNIFFTKVFNAVEVHIIFREFTDKSA